MACCKKHMACCKKHMACCKKHKAFILKYKAHILKYVPCIFSLFKFLINSNLQSLPKNHLSFWFSDICRKTARNTA